MCVTNSIPFCQTNKSSKLSIFLLSISPFPSYPFPPSQQSPLFNSDVSFQKRGHERGGRHVEGEAALRFDEAERRLALEHDLFGDRLREQLVEACGRVAHGGDRKSTRLNSSHANISYA